jgi:hypothetical protein
MRGSSTPKRGKSTSDNGKPTRSPVRPDELASLAAWHPYVIDRSGRIDRRYYELCALWELRAALRAGDVWLETSRRYANPESYLIPPVSWPALRPEIGFI